MLSGINLHNSMLAAVAKSRTDPIWFLETFLNIKTNKQDKKRSQNWSLDPWQRELIEAAADVWRFKNNVATKYNHGGKRNITVRAMHGPGKTFGVACIMHWFNFVFYGQIICTAPKEKQLCTRLWPAFRKICARAGPAYSSLIKIDSTRITWCNDVDWAAHAETASEPENLSGYHYDYQLFIVDEASGVREEMYPVIEGAQSTGILNITILIGNPTRNRGTFYDSHLKQKVAQHYYQIHVDLNKTTRVPLEWVKQMEDKYGRGSPIVDIRCYGRFAKDDSNQLIPLAWIDDARREWTPDGSLPTLKIACDVADGGLDETVITVALEFMSFTVLKSIHRFSFPSSESPILAAKACLRIAEANGYSVANGDLIIVDSIGVGAGTAGYLIDSKTCTVVAFKSGSTDSIDTRQWRNQRVRSFIVMRDMFRDGKIVIDEYFCSDVDWEDFIAQMCSVQSKPGLERTEDLVGKEEMRRNGVKSPDMADSPAMIFANQTPHIGSYINTDTEIIGQLESAVNGSW